MPTRTRLGAVATKSTINSSATVSGLNATLAVGDFVEVAVAVDPGNAISSVGLNTGTAVLGAFGTTLTVISSGGSGTTGSKVIHLRAVCTTAGTLTSLIVQCTLTSPRTVEVAQVVNVDQTTPVLVSIAGTSIDIPAGGAGRALTGVAILGNENPGGTAVTAAKSGTDSANWASGTQDTTTTGTTGSSNATNIGVATGHWDRSSAVQTTGLSLSLTPAAGAAAQGIVIWQGPAPASGTVTKAKTGGSIVTATCKAKQAGVVVTAPDKVRVAGVLV